MYYLFRVLEGVWGPGRGAGLLLWAGQGDGLRGGGGRSRGDQCHVGKASKWKNNKQTNNKSVNFEEFQVTATPSLTFRIYRNIYWFHYYFFCIFCLMITKNKKPLAISIFCIFLLFMASLR